MKGIMRFAKKGNLSQHFFGPYEILEKLGDLAYRLTVPLNLSSVYDMFYMSMLRKCMHDSLHVLEFEPLEVREDLTYEEKPVEILDRRDQVPRTKTIPLVKVL